jgi:hypothetical protein
LYLDGYPINQNTHLQVETERDVEEAFAAVANRGPYAVVTTGRPFGDSAWVQGTATLLGIDLSERQRGRPSKRVEKSTALKIGPLDGR